MPVALSISSRLLLAMVALMTLIGATARAGDDRPPIVAASILPVHSLLANLVDEDRLLPPLLPPSASPHSYALRPSEARRLRKAEVIFWVGPTLESVLARPLATLAESVRVVALFPGPAKADPHIWLDPVKAKTMVRRMAAVLAEVDPVRAEEYHQREKALIARLSALTASLDIAFAPVRRQPFITAHEAYSRLEARFGLNALGAVSPSTEQPASARQLAGIHARMKASDARCIFAEPQYQPRSLNAVAADSGARITLLDPLGSGLDPGPDAYFTLMRALTEHMVSCLGAPDQ